MLKDEVIKINSILIKRIKDKIKNKIEIHYNNIKKIQKNIKNKEYPNYFVKDIEYVLFLPRYWLS